MQLAALMHQQDPLDLPDMPAHRETTRFDIFRDARGVFRDISPVVCSLILHIVDCALAYNVWDQVAIKVPRVDSRHRGVIDGVSEHNSLVVGQVLTHPCNFPDTPAMQKREFWAKCMLAVHC